MAKQMIESGFPAIDLIAGGYKKGEVTVIKVSEDPDRQDKLQDFIIRQAMSFSSKDGLPNHKALFISLNMSEKQVLSNILEDLNIYD